MSEHSYETSLNKHYGREGLTDIIIEALRASGLNLEALRPDDLGFFFNTSINNFT